VKRTSSSATSRSAKIRLTNALSTLTSASQLSLHRPSVSRLCRLACVSRNTLYRYYPDVAEAVRRLRRHRGARRPGQESTVRALRSELATLRVQVAKLAALADHYHAAAAEARALLARRDRELATLRARLHLAPVVIER
jgi:hypothetical protein